jgi:hypothetical protein
MHKGFEKYYCRSEFDQAAEARLIRQVNPLPSNHDAVLMVGTGQADLGSPP